MAAWGITPTLTGGTPAAPHRSCTASRCVRDGLVGTSQRRPQARSSVATVTSVLRESGYPARLIHGHTHRPGRHVHLVDGRACERWVLPDWYERGGYLEASPAGIRAVKRPGLPLTALEGLARRRPAARLWYAGPVLDPAEGSQLLAGLATRPWARYLGAVPHAAMPALLAAADIVLNCSLSEGGMANAVLEALALGRAVLASDIPGNRSLIEPDVTGLLWDSEAELAEGAERLAADPALRGRLGEAGRRLVAERFTPTAEAEVYLAVYARVWAHGR